MDKSVMGISHIYSVDHLKTTDGVFINPNVFYSKSSFIYQLELKNKTNSGIYNFNRKKSAKSKKNFYLTSLNSQKQKQMQKGNF